MRHNLKREMSIFKKSPAYYEQRGKNPIYMRHTLKRALRILKKSPAYPGGKKKKPYLYASYSEQSPAHFEKEPCTFCKQKGKRALHILKAKGEKSQ